MKLRFFIPVVFVAVFGLGVWGMAQQQKFTPPSDIHLNAEASSAYIDLEKSKAELARQYQMITSQQLALLVGAGVPVEMRGNCAANNGVVTCSKPEAAKAQPSPK